MNVFGQPAQEMIAELAEQAARSMSDEQLSEQSAVLEIYARALRDEWHRRKDNPRIDLLEPMGHA